MTWAERIAAALKRGQFTRDDLSLAESFTSCAVGERFGSEPGSWSREYPPIYVLGMNFYLYVHASREAETVWPYYVNPDGYTDRDYEARTPHTTYIERVRQAATVYAQIQRTLCPICKDHPDHMCYTMPDGSCTAINCHLHPQG